MLIQHRGFNRAQLDQFRVAQKASFAVLEQVAAGLESGVTERQAANRLTREYRKLGVSSYFHLPVALFGARTALPGCWRLRDFWPTRNRLRDGDAIILDASPIFEGYLVDTSYSTRLGENAVHHQMMMDLEQIRKSILVKVRTGETFTQIAVATDETIRALGYDNRHRAHLEEVLGHRAIRLRNPRPSWIYKKGFDIQALGWFALHTIAARNGLWRFSPNWNNRPTSNHAPWDGLWAVEPHFGKGCVGAKWEELLVIQNGSAFWLDDDTPHTRYWEQHRPII